MSELTVKLSVETQRLSEAFAELSRAIGESLLPAMTKAASVLRDIYNSWPGMPYTAPSLWDADQMIGDRGVKP